MEEKAKKLAELIKKTDFIVIGAGSGLSTSAGLVFTGERFRKHYLWLKNLTHGGEVLNMASTANIK